MNKAINIFSSIFWLAVLLVSLVFAVYRFVTGNGDPFTPLIVIVLFAINFNITSMLNIKQKELENTNMIIEKVSSPIQQNPYLN